MATSPSAVTTDSLLAQGYKPETTGQPSQPNQTDSLLAQGYTLETPSDSPNVGASPEEEQFLKANPTHQWVSADPNKPNVQPGIYPKSAVADMAKDPTMEHHPIDLNFAKNTAEGAGWAAGATGLATGAGWVAPLATAVATHLDTVKKVIDYAERIGIRGMEYRTARDILKEVSGDKK
jgi:hypothetical protein